VPRRNFYLGLWAARQLGIIDGLQRDYVRGVVASDYEQPGYEDLFRKLAGDFSVCGLAFSSRRSGAAASARLDHRPLAFRRVGLMTLRVRLLAR